MRKGTILKTAFDVYTVGAKIGEGGNGTVYEVLNKDDEILAVKIISKKKTSNSKIKRFKRELFFCLTNRHQNIVKVSDYGIHILGEEEYIFYIMPRYKYSLKDIMKGDINPEDTLKIFSNIAEGLEYAHSRGTYHRDIKPENILCNSSDDVVIADFGIAHFEEEMVTAIETKPADRLANFKYSAPEQKVKGAAVSGTADIYALGLILNEMFTNNVPQGSSYPKIGDANSDYEFLDGLVDDMIQHVAGDRHQTIMEVKIDLQARIDDKAISDELQKTLAKKIDESELKDPLLFKVPNITKTYLDNDMIVFELDEYVSPLWAQWFQKPGTHNYILGYDTSRFIIDRRKISVQLINEYSIELIKDIKRNLESWIEKSNAQYIYYIKQRHKEKIDKKVKEQNDKIQRLERQKQINAELNDIS